MSRFVALFVALVAGVAAAVWYYRAPDDGSRPVRVAVARNDDRWLDDLLSRTPKDVEMATAELDLPSDGPALVMTSVRGNPLSVENCKAVHSDR